MINCINHFAGQTGHRMRIDVFLLSMVIQQGNSDVVG